jgi:sporulation protein YlmC with PRC-barrel domain
MEHREETANLISGDKVSGTSVYNTAGESVGEIQDVMIDKASGKVVYAVMSFGGFLGMGEKYHPLPWELLKYDSSREGYVVDLSKTQLEGAPTYDEGVDPGWGNREYEANVHKYYKTPPYWGAL